MKRLLLLLLFFLILSISGFLLILRTPKFSTFLASKAGFLVEQFLGVPIQISWMRWNPFLNTIVLGDVVWLRQNELPWMELPWMEVQFGWFDFSFRPIRARKVVVVQPRLRFLLDEKGELLPLSQLFASLSLKENSPSQGEGGTPTFEIQELETIGGELDLTIKEPPMHLHLTGVHVLVQFKDGKPDTLSLQWEKGEFELFSWLYQEVRGNVQGRFAGSDLHLERIEVSASSPSLVFYGSGTISPHSQPFLKLELGGSVDTNLVNLHYTPIPQFLGNALMAVTLEASSVRGIELQGSVYARDLLFQGNLVEEFLTELTLREHTGIEFSKISINLGEGSVEGKGDLRWDRGVHMRFDTTMDRVSLALLESVLGKLPFEPAGTYSGEVSLVLAVEPRFSALISGKGALDLSHFILLPGHPLPPFSGSVSLALELDDREVRFREFTFAHQEFQGEITGSVPLKVPHPFFKGHLYFEQLEPWMESGIGIPSRGKAHILFELHGEELSLEIQGAPLHFYTTEFDRVAASLSLLGQHLKISRLQGETGSGSLYLQGELELSSLSYSGTAILHHFSLPALGILHDLSGSVTGEIQVMGRGDKIPRVSGDLTLSLEPLPDHFLTLSLSSTNEGFHGSFTGIASGEVLGRWEQGGIYFSSGFRLRVPEPLLAFVPVQELKGESSGSCSRLSKDACFLQLGLRGSDAPPYAFFSSLLWEEGNLDLLLQLGESSLYLYRTARDPRYYAEGVWKGSFTLKEFSLDNVACEFYYHWDVLKSWKEGSGILELQSASGRLKGLPFTLTAPVHSVISKGIFSWQQLRLVVLNRYEVVANGSFSPFSTYPSDLNITGQLPASILSLFWKDSLLTRGNFSFALKIRDALETPRITGTVQLTQGEGVIPGIDEPIVNIHGEGIITDNLLALKTVEGEWGDGRVMASGRIRLYPDPLQDLEIRGTLESKRIAIRHDLNSGARGKVLITSTPQRKVLVEGELELFRLLFRPQILWEKALLSWKRNGDLALPQEGVVELRLHLKGNTEILAQTNLFEGPLSFELTLLGSPQQPAITGNLVLLPTGVILFRNRTYQIRRGVLTFADPRKIAPFFDLEAETVVYSSSERQRYRIRLEVYGPYENLTIRFFSDPPLEELDILSLLSFGVRSRELGESQKTPGQTGGVELANLVLSTQISRIEEELKGIAGFDLIEIQPYFVSSQGGSSMLLTAEKRLTDRLRLRAGTTLDATGEQRVELSYDLTRNLRILAGWDNRTAVETGNFSLRPRIWFPLP